MKKSFYVDLPWNKGCDPESWYRKVGPLKYEGDTRQLVWVHKVKFGKWKDTYYEKTLWGWWR